MIMTIRDRINADIARNEAINEGILQAAAELIKTDAPDDYIMKVTKLSPEDITKLRKELISNY